MYQGYHWNLQQLNDPICKQSCHAIPTVAADPKHEIPAPGVSSKEKKCSLNQKTK